MFTGLHVVHELIAAHAVSMDDKAMSLWLLVFILEVYLDFLLLLEGTVFFIVCRWVRKDDPVFCLASRILL